MKYKDQNIKDLRYFYSNNNTKHNLTIIKSKKILLSKLSICMDILSESHNIKIFKGKKIIFNEIVSCKNLPLSSLVPSFNKVSEDLFLYEFFSSETEFKNNNIENHFMNKSDIFITDLYYNFESKNNLNAFTKISLFKNDKDIVILTIHTYPNEKKAFFTKSILKGVLNEKF
jgi:hypothetical protein